MRWGDGDTTPFVRPVTWLVALLGEQVIPVSFAGIESSDQSRGHRFLENHPVAVKAKRESYLAALRDNKVIVDQGERKDKIRAALLDTAGKAGLAWRTDEDLLDTVTYLLEWSVPVLCSFDSKLLEIPEEVLVSEMREHQKLFALTDGSGKLNNHFAAMSNMEAKDYTLIREGNESVVRARFADAEFFLREDRKKKLLDRRQDLKAVAFLKDLGEGASIYSKTVRVERLASELGLKLGWDAKKIETAKAIASLCKNDLTTQMVGEFPELQGTVGRYYALGEGLSDTIADGIADHYKPRNADDGFPETHEGALVGIADRFDTMVGMFAKGKIPTGSADPFALRRACSSSIMLLVRLEVNLPLNDLLETSLNQFSLLEISTSERDGLLRELLAFFMQRIDRLFTVIDTTRWNATDHLNAILKSTTPWTFPTLKVRVDSLDFFSKNQGDHFFQIVEVFKRISNILKDAAPVKMDAAKLGQPSEKKLLQALGQAAAAVQSAVQSQAWDKALAEIARLQTPVAELFVAVMVNDPDLEVRKNRHSLLQAVREVVLEVADFSAFQIS